MSKDAVWYHATDQQCWVRAAPSDGVDVFTDKAKAAAAAAKFAPAGTVLYQADWSTGLNGWPGLYGWKVLNGQLLNDGTCHNELIAAPVDLSGVPNYAVEADIQIARRPDIFNYGLYARDGSYVGYVDDYDFFGRHNAAISSKDADIAAKGFEPGTDKHTYRLEVNGNNIKLSIDGVVLVEGVDNTSLDGGKAGLRCNRVQLIVMSFRVIKL